MDEEKKIEGGRKKQKDSAITGGEGYQPSKTKDLKQTKESEVGRGDDLEFRHESSFKWRIDSLLTLGYLLAHHFQGPTKRKAKDKSGTFTRSPSEEPCRFRKRKATSKEQNKELLPKVICTSLRVLDWLWCELWSGSATFVP